MDGGQLPLEGGERRVHLDPQVIESTSRHPWSRNQMSSSATYRNVRPDYVEKLWSLVNWTDVKARFDAARN